MKSTMIIVLMALGSLVAGCGGESGVAPAPTNLKAVPHLTSVALLFDAPKSPSFQVTDYATEYRQPGGAWITVDHVPSKATSASVEQLTPDTKYEFRVAAVNAAGHGPWTATVSAATLKDTGTDEESTVDDDFDESCGNPLLGGNELVIAAGDYVEAANALQSNSSLWLQGEIDSAEKAARQLLLRITALRVAYEALAPYRKTRSKGAGPFLLALPPFHRAEIAFGTALRAVALGGSTAGLEKKMALADTLRAPIARAWEKWAAYCEFDLDKPDPVDPEY